MESVFPISEIPAVQPGAAPIGVSPALARAAFLLAVLACCAAGFLATDAQSALRATAEAGPELTRLLRVMTLIKAAMALAASAAAVWRLGSPIGPVWFAGYTLAAGAAVAGPGLIWGMAHVTAGAILLHGGIALCVLLLWRDPAVSLRLEALVTRRRAQLRRRAG
jgi:hypothetical protein